MTCGIKTIEITADKVFLQAFDAAIEHVHQQLTLSGLNEASIWAGFHRATAVLAEISVDVEDEASPGLIHAAGKRTRQI